MTVINTTVDNLIRSIKNTGSVDDIKFVKAYRNSAAQKPLGGLCAVVNLRSIEPRKSFLSSLAPNGLKGEVLSATLNLRLYSAGAGDELTGAALRLGDAVRTADSSGLVSGIKISPISFDSESCEVYRDVNAQLGFLLCEDGDEANDTE